MRLLHKCWHKNSVEISVLKKFISDQIQNKEVAVPIDEK